MTTKSMTKTKRAAIECKTDEWLRMPDNEDQWACFVAAYQTAPFPQSLAYLRGWGFNAADIESGQRLHAPDRR